MTRGTAAARPDSLLANTDYIAYWVARAFSVLGSQASYVAFPLMALALLQDPLQAAAVGACNYAATLAVGLHAGVVADRWNRKYVMLFAESMQAVVMAAVASAVLVGDPALMLLCMLAFANGSLFAVYGAASGAALPDIVGSRLLDTALARNQSRDFLLAMAGPTLGATLFVVHPALPFVLNATTFVLACLCTVVIRTSSVASEPSRGPSRAAIAEGLAVLRDNPTLRYGMLFFTGQAFVLTGAFFTVISLLSSSGQPVAAGGVAAAQALGGFLGSLVAVRLFRRFSGTVLLASQGLLWACGLTAVALMPRPVTVGVFMGVLWCIVPTTRIVYQKHLAATVSRHLRGRVQSVGFLTQSTASPLGPLAAGVAIGLTSEQATLLVLALTSLVVTSLAVLLPAGRRVLEWRREASPADAASAGAGS